MVIFSLLTGINSNYSHCMISLRQNKDKNLDLQKLILEGKKIHIKKKILKGDSNLSNFS